MNQKSEPSLRDCLAYEVLENYQTWLGVPSPTYLFVFLFGTAVRAGLTAQIVPNWRVYGPLENPEFYLPLIARTGHPTLSIRWAKALEIHHFSLDESMRELRELMQDWVQIHGLVTEDTLETGVVGSDPRAGLHDLLKKLARRPGMYLGARSGWALRCFLAGIDRGGDWLGLPTLPGLRAVVDGIEQASEEGYGSRFAAYRIYEESPSELLAWVGIEPE